MWCGRGKRINTEINLKTSKMKTINSDVYLSLLDDYLSGKGMDLDSYHLNKSDIEPMMAFFARILKPETYVSVSLYIIAELINN